MHHPDQTGSASQLSVDLHSRTESVDVVPVIFLWFV